MKSEVDRKVHIVPYGLKWAVRKDGNTRVSSIHRTRKEALEFARKITSNTVIHNRPKDYNWA